MPRFHFHVYDGVDSLDEEGIELFDLDAARDAAIRGVRDLMSEAIKTKGRIRLSDSIEITDPRGLRLHVMRYGDCVEIEP